MIWRMLASVLVMSDQGQRQRQIMKHEQANERQQGGHGLPQQRPTMNRDDMLVWLSLVWFVGLCGAAIWVLFSPAYDIFGI